MSRSGDFAAERDSLARFVLQGSFVTFLGCFCFCGCYCIVVVVSVIIFLVVIAVVVINANADFVVFFLLFVVIIAVIQFSLSFLLNIGMILWTSLLL